MYVTEGGGFARAGPFACLSLLPVLVDKVLASISTFHFLLMFPNRRLKKIFKAPSDNACHSTTNQCSFNYKNVCCNCFNCKIEFTTNSFLLQISDAKYFVRTKFDLNQIFILTLFELKPISNMNCLLTQHLFGLWPGLLTITSVFILLNGIITCQRRVLHGSHQNWDYCPVEWSNEIVTTSNDIIANYGKEWLIFEQKFFNVF